MQAGGSLHKTIFKMTQQNQILGLDENRHRSRIDYSALNEGKMDRSNEEDERLETNQDNQVTVTGKASKKRRVQSRDNGSNSITSPSNLGVAEERPANEHGSDESSEENNNLLPQEQIVEEPIVPQSSQTKRKEVPLQEKLEKSTKRVEKAREEKVPVSASTVAYSYYNYYLALF